MLQRGPMPPKDGSNKNSDSKKTKKWTPVPRSPQEEAEDAKCDNVPKLPNRRGYHKKKPTNKADVEEVEEKPEKTTRGRMSRRRNTAPRRGPPPAKKVEEKSETLPQENGAQDGNRVNKDISQTETPEVPKVSTGSTGEDEGGLRGAPTTEVDNSSEVVDEIPERLFRCFFSQRTDLQAFVGIMRLFQNASDKTMQRIHQLVINMLLDDFQSFPYWPEKELLMVGELLGQFIRWDLIPDGGPLQLALCCILSALKESPASLLYRFGQRALEQFKCRFAHHDVASQMSRQMQQTPQPLHEEEPKQQEQPVHFNPFMFPPQPAMFLPWPLFPGLGQQDLVMRMLIPHAHHPAAPASSRSHQAGRPKANQQDFSKWMFDHHASKAAPRSQGNKQGILAWSEPEKDRHERKDKEGKNSKKKAAKNKKANADSSGRKAGSSGTAPLPPFIEVDMDSMEFQLSDDDVPDVDSEKVRKVVKAGKSTVVNKKVEENKEDEAEDEVQDEVGDNVQCNGGGDATP